jgi:hypothetical protein
MWRNCGSVKNIIDPPNWMFDNVWYSKKITRAAAFVVPWLSCYPHLPSSEDGVITLFARTAGGRAIDRPHQSLWRWWSGQLVHVETKKDLPKKQGMES